MDILMDKHNLTFKSGDFVVVNGITQVKQHIITTLNTMLGEWVFDTTKGINYSKSVRNTVFFENCIKKQILGVQGVISTENLKISFDKVMMTVHVRADVITEYGALLLNETIET